jgi:hypothetical protein
VKGNRDHEICSGFNALGQALLAVPGVEEKHVHSLFRFLDTSCCGFLPADEVSDAIYGPMDPAQMRLIQETYEVSSPV